METIIASGQVMQTLSNCAPNSQVTPQDNITTYDSSQSLSFHINKPQVSLVHNAHPQLTIEKTRHSKPKVFLVCVEPTSLQNVVSHPQWL